MARASVAIAAAGLLAMAVGAAEAETTLKFGHYNAESHPMHKAAAQFKENVERRTGGEVLVEIYPNNTLGSPPEILEQTRNGVVDIAVPTSGQLDKYDKAFAALMMPFAFADLAHARHAMDGPMLEWLSPKAESAGLEIIGVWEYGFRNLRLERLIVSLWGVVTLFGTVLMILSVIVGAIALVMSMRQPARYGGKALAMVGPVLSILLMVAVVGAFAFRRMQGPNRIDIFGLNASRDRMIQYYFDNSWEGPVSHDLQAWHIPCLIFMGAADNDFLEQAQRAATEIPTAEFLALGDADHYAAHTSQDELLLDAVLRTLRANS